jgi:predicted alpha/beta hydrolase
VQIEHPSLWVRVMEDYYATPAAVDRFKDKLPNSPSTVRDFSRKELQLPDHFKDHEIHFKWARSNTETPIATAIHEWIQTVLSQQKSKL